MHLTSKDRLFVLTGAGISAESGLATFRGSGGLWNGHSVEDVATPEAWEANPALVWRFYSQRRRDALAAQSFYEDPQALPSCNQCGQPIRPHIVWFGEIPLDMDAIYRELNRATTLLVVGTSGSVYPAAGFVNIANQRRIRTIYVGPEEPLNLEAFDEVILSPATEALPSLLP